MKWKSVICSGGTRLFFFLGGGEGGTEGAKFVPEGGKIQKFAKNCWFWSFFLLSGGKGAEYEQKSSNPNYTKFWIFWQKMVNRFWQSVDAILEDVSASETIVWCKTINLKTTIFQCSKNNGVASQVKSCTNHDWPDQSQKKKKKKKKKKQTVSLQKFAYFVLYL